MSHVSPSDVIREEWWTLDVSPGIDLSQPGIYEWRIGDDSVYVGKSKRLSGRIREYPNNVRKLLTGAPYRRGKQAAYRDIHRDLRSAHDAFVKVTVTILENCLVSELNERERHWIALRRTEAGQGGPRVINAT
jgi:hypothetical protein